MPAFIAYRVYRPAGSQRFRAGGAADGSPSAYRGGKFAAEYTEVESGKNHAQERDQSSAEHTAR